MSSGRGGKEAGECETEKRGKETRKRKKAGEMEFLEAFMHGRPAVFSLFSFSVAVRRNGHPLGLLRARNEQYDATARLRPCPRGNFAGAPGESLQVLLRNVISSQYGALCHCAFLCLALEIH